MSDIHPTAIVSSQAIIGRNVRIGAYSIIEADVRIGDECGIDSHVVVKSGTSIGNQNQIHAGAVIGDAPQHQNCPEKTGTLEIGNGNVIREFVTIHRGLKECDKTSVGDSNLLMANAHVGHDCVVGNLTIIANNAMIAGHVHINDQAYVSGAVGIHQFCRVGRLAMVGGQAHITKDVPPFVTVDGLSSRIVGLNLVGLRRAGLNTNAIRMLKAAYRLAFRSGLRWEAMLEKMNSSLEGEYANELYDFMSNSKRGCILERATPKTATIRLRKFDSHESQTDSKTDAA